jgi:FMN phosphatase YigB (HAD superfamily)
MREGGMTVSEMMEEFQLEIDDIRWYLSTGMAERLLTYRDNPEELEKLIWSGKLGDDLYHMEEQYLSNLEDEHSRGLLDEVQIRNFFHEALAAKRKRYKTNKSY